MGFEWMGYDWNRDLVEPPKEDAGDVPLESLGLSDEESDIARALVREGDGLALAPNRVLTRDVAKFHRLVRGIDYYVPPAAGAAANVGRFLSVAIAMGAIPRGFVPTTHHDSGVRIIYSRSGLDYRHMTASQKKAGEGRHVFVKFDRKGKVDVSFSDYGADEVPGDDPDGIPEIFPVEPTREAFAAVIGRAREYLETGKF